MKSIITRPQLTHQLPEAQFRKGRVVRVNSNDESSSELESILSLDEYNASLDDYYFSNNKDPESLSRHKFPINLSMEYLNSLT
uniref:Uncharacterized protein n=1 Tax=Rhabditophanes sp. KR3021 TaxID=114890 RepID=A0AC35TYX0_9BILA